MIHDIGNINFVAKGVHYHSACRKEYQRRAESISKTNMKNNFPFSNTVLNQSNSEWHNARDHHKQAFEIICAIVDESIIDKKQVWLLNTVNKYYINVLIEIGGSEYAETVITTQKLQEKLIYHYNDKIVIQKEKRKGGNIVFSKMLDLQEVARKEMYIENDIQCKVQELAYKIRRDIFECDKTPLPKKNYIRRFI